MPCVAEQVNAPLRFVADTHTYSVGDTALPSVTSLIDGALVNYAGIPPAVLAHARDMGRAVHLATKLHDDGDLDEASLDPRLRPYLDAYLRFRAETDFETHLVEQPLYHPKLLYAGTPDRAGMLDRALIVLDLKKMLVLSSWIGTQLAAYAELLRVNGCKVKKRYALSLRADGTYRLREFRSVDDWPCFLALLALKNWQTKHG